MQLVISSLRIIGATVAILSGLFVALAPMLAFITFPGEFAAGMLTVFAIIPAAALGSLGLWVYSIGDDIQWHRENAALFA